MALIELKAARVQLDEQAVFQALDFELNAGQSVSVTGENGAGKTTFLRLLSGDIWPVRAESRRYFFGDKPMWSPLRARQQIALVSPLSQERAVRLAQDGADNERGARLTVRECVATGLFDSFLLHQRPTEEQQAQVDTLLEQFSLAELSEHELQTLSQGQLRRVLLARALVKCPRVVLLDEAASGLDERARTGLFVALEVLAQSGTTFVFASHRAEELPMWTTRWTIRNGRIEKGADEIGALFQTPSAPLSPSSIEPATFVIPGRNDEESIGARPSVSNEEPEVDPSSFLPAMTKVAGFSTSTGAKGSSPTTSPNNPLATANSTSSTSTAGDIQTLAPLFHLRNVSVFLGGAPVLRALHFDWPRGAHLRVIGENGSGKTTLLRLLSGELPAAFGGTIVRLGERAPRPIWEWRRRIALVSPALQARFHDALPVRDALASGFEGGFVAPRALNKVQENALEDALDVWKLRGLQTRRFDRLSYGQTRRVLLARALVASPEVVLLDEALDGLDASTREFCLGVWQELAQNGTHFAFASHHDADFPAWTERGIELENGHLKVRL